MLGLYLVLTHQNLFKTIVGLSLAQSGIILFFVLLAVRDGATVPILAEGDDRPLNNPLPHALMLTAIVVAVSTLGVALAILRRLQEEEGSIVERRRPEEEP
ncbi:MAG: cation:proton antiporter subunit C [Planctomycetes bacterium]|nr:cation:proton antiporter subunit C [Planctomycetota bacterium]